MILEASRREDNRRARVCSPDVAFPDSAMMSVVDRVSSVASQSGSNANSMTDFSPLPSALQLTEEDEEFQRRFRSWLDEHVPHGPAPTAQVELQQYCQAWQSIMADHGWAGVSWPRQFGGLGATAVQQYLYYEELAFAEAPDFPNRAGLILLAPILMQYGCTDLCDLYLPGILRAKEIWAQGFSEPGAGSDLASVRTTARIEGSRWRIDGQKTWITGADSSTHAAVLCRTGDPAKRHRTLSLLLVDLDQAGVLVRPIRASDDRIPFCEIFFDGATTPLDHAVGGIGNGWAAAMTMLEYERGDVTFTDHRPIFRHIRTIGAKLDAHIQTRPISRRNELVDRLREAWLQTHHLRELNIQMMYRRTEEGALGYWSSPVKVLWARLVQEVHRIALDAVDLLGDPEADEIGDYLYSRMSTVYSGALEIQLSVIAERLLGLPRASGAKKVPE
jgi:alkylation response protein AidB-like acyl-CoA dehydrogenase